jgi:hypothetical protein
MMGNKTRRRGERDEERKIWGEGVSNTALREGSVG